MTHSNINWEVVRDGTMTRHSALCTRIQVDYQVDELWGYSAEGEDSREYISVHRVKRFAEIHIGCQQPTAEVTRSVRTRSANMRSTVDFLGVKPDYSWRR